MGAAAVPLFAVGLAMTAVSTGLAFYGQMQQAQAQAQMARYNQQMQQQAAAIAYQQALLQNDVMVRQNQLMQQQAQAAQLAAVTNAATSRQISLLNQQQTEAQIMGMQNNALVNQRNAQAAEGEANALQAQARERARRQQEQSDRVMAAFRSKGSRSGVTNEGSPLAIMGDAAWSMELAKQDAFYEIGLQADAMRQKGRIQEWQSGVSLWETQFPRRDAEVMSLKAGLEQQMFALDYQMARYEQAAAQWQGQALMRSRQLAGIEFQYGLAAARGNYMQGMNQANAYRVGAFGSLLSGAGSIGMQAGAFFQPSQVVYTART
jgi:hypothetical protein